jgi:site-specific DNA-methyltransferase (adenine-specific)
MSNIKNYKYDWVWEKDKPSNFLMGKKQPLRYSENISVFYKSQVLYNPQMQKRTNKNKRKNKLTSSLLKDETKNIKLTDKYQDRLKSGVNDYIYPKNIQKFNNRTKGLHPTQKPIVLIEYLIKTYTNENETVLDFTMGSGTTGVACKNLNRNFIGIEMDDKYFEIAKKRIEETPIKLF